MESTSLRRIVLCMALAPAAIAASPAAAWGPIGHRITGQIAQDNIAGRTRAAVEQILEHEDLAEASTVPDEERSNPSQFWKEAGAYHFITLPPSAGIEQLAHPPEGDAETALQRFTATLRDPAASREDKAVALRFVVHIVGDLHNPLHTGRDGDRGGNDVKVLWFDVPNNLHWVWDEGMILRQQLSYSEYADRLEARTTPAQVLEWWDANPRTWMAESVSLRDKVYPATGPVAGMGTAEAPVRLFYQYNYDWTPTMERRLQQAGIRVAAYLDWVFAAQP